MIPAYKFIDCAYQDDIHMFGYYETNAIFIPETNIAGYIQFNKTQVSKPYHHRNNAPTIIGLAIGFRDNGQVNVDAVEIPEIKNTVIHGNHISHFMKNVECINLPISFVTQCISTYNAIIATRNMMASLKTIALPKTNGELANDIWLKDLHTFDCRNNYTRDELANFLQATQNAIALYPDNVFYHERLLQIICHKDVDKSMVDEQVVANVLQTILDFHYGCYDSLLLALGTFQNSPCVVEVFRKHMLNVYEIQIQVSTYNMRDYCNTYKFTFKPQNNADSA
jgi:hypothetical protein